MTHFRRLLVAVLGAVSLVGAAVVSVSAHEADAGGVRLDDRGKRCGSRGTGSERSRNQTGWRAVGAHSGSGEVDRKGNVHVEVVGLIIPGRGNPVPTFNATVSCLTRTAA